MNDTGRRLPAVRQRQPAVRVRLAVRERGGDDALARELLVLPGHLGVGDVDLLVRDAEGDAARRRRLRELLRAWTACANALSHARVCTCMCLYCVAWERLIFLCAMLKVMSRAAAVSVNCCARGRVSACACARERVHMQVFVWRGVGDVDHLEHDEKGDAARRRRLRDLLVGCCYLCCYRWWCL